MLDFNSPTSKGGDPVRDQQGRTGLPTSNSGSIHRLGISARSEEHTSELQSPCNLVCRLLLEKKKNIINRTWSWHAIRVSCSIIPVLHSHVRDAARVVVCAPFRNINASQTMPLVLSLLCVMAC